MALPIEPAFAQLLSNCYKVQADCVRLPKRLALHNACVMDCVMDCVMQSQAFTFLDLNPG